MATAWPMSALAPGGFTSWSDWESLHCCWCDMFLELFFGWLVLFFIFSRGLKSVFSLLPRVGKVHTL